jgi:hypothetical protein
MATDGAPSSNSSSSSSSSSVALLTDVCDLRAHACLVLARLMPALKLPLGGAEGGAASLPQEQEQYGMAVRLWAALLDGARVGYEEALRLDGGGDSGVSGVGQALAGPWLAALSSALLRLLAAVPDLGVSPAAQIMQQTTSTLDSTAPSTSSSSSGGGGGNSLAFLRLLALRGPAPDARGHCVRALAMLAQRWYAAATMSGGGGGGSDASSSSSSSSSSFAAWTREAVEGLLGALEDGDVTVSAAAADVLMDTFSEDDAPLHELYVSAGCQERLVAAHAAMRAKVRDGRERDAMGREALAHVKEVLLNTARFLKYKANFAAGRR